VTLENILFVAFAGLAIGMALMMVLHRNPLVCAIYLIGNFFCLAALYLLLRAQLLAILQIAVYAGAIMVLVIFVIMLLNLGEEKGVTHRFNLRTIVGGTFAAAFLLELVVLMTGSPEANRPFAAEAGTIGTVEAIGRVMYTGYLFPLQVTGMLLLGAVVGAVILAKRQLS
jgi:NADH-quinone oxidoreductase subunit J